MPVDPSDPDTFEDLEGEFDDGSPLGDRSLETPEADATEQRLELQDERGFGSEELTDSLEVNPADAVEQARAVEAGEEDYR